MTSLNISLKDQIDPIMANTRSDRGEALESLVAEVERAARAEIAQAVETALNAMESAGAIDDPALMMRWAPVPTLRLVESWICAASTIEQVGKMLALGTRLANDTNFPAQFYANHLMHLLGEAQKRATMLACADTERGVHEVLESILTMEGMPLNRLGMIVDGYFASGTRQVRIHNDCYLSCGETTAKCGVADLVKIAVRLHPLSQELRKTAEALLRRAVVIASNWDDLVALSECSIGPNPPNAWEDIAKEQVSALTGLATTSPDALLDGAAVIHGLYSNDADMVLNISLPLYEALADRRISDAAILHRWEAQVASLLENWQDNETLDTLLRICPRNGDIRVQILVQLIRNADDLATLTGLCKFLLGRDDVLEIMIGAKTDEIIRDMREHSPPAEVAAYQRIPKKMREASAAIGCTDEIRQLNLYRYLCEAQLAPRG
jgi:hypothetical protein